MTEQENNNEKLKETLPLEHSERISDKTDLEELLFFGPYQIAVLIAYQLVTFTFAFNLLFMTFVGSEPLWQCGTINSSNSTNADRCDRFQNGQCLNITWSNESFNSIVSEWELVCSKRSIVYLIITLQMVGLLLGAPLMTQISDLRGRRRALLACLAGESVVGIGTGFSHTWHTFATCRFFVGFSTGALIPIISVYLVESVNRRNRMLFMSLGGVNMGFLLSAGIFFLFQHWRTLSIVANSAGIVALLIVGFACETPRWLLHHGKMEQARKSYRYILRLNRKLDKQLSDHEWEALLDKAKGQKCERRSFGHLFRTRRLFLNTAVLVLATFTLNVISTVLMFSMNNLAGSIYLNSIIYGIVLWASAVSSSLIDRLCRSVGRKHMIGSAFSVLWLCLLGMSISKWLESNIHILETVLVFVGTATTSPLWISLTLTTLESYPTSIRSIAVGLCSIFANIGGVVGPQLLMMAQKWKPLPWVAPAFVSFLLFVAYMIIIAETKGRPLPEEMQDRTVEFVVIIGKVDAGRQSDSDGNRSRNVFCRPSIRVLLDLSTEEKSMWTNCAIRVHKIMKRSSGSHIESALSKVVNQFVELCIFCFCGSSFKKNHNDVKLPLRDFEKSLARQRMDFAMCKTERSCSSPFLPESSDEESANDKLRITLPLKQLQRSTEQADLEDLLFFGPYQIAVLIAYQLVTFTFAFNLLFVTFVGSEPPWECMITNASSNSTNADRCDRFQNGQCLNITWSDESFNSIVSEWELICTNKSTVYLIITIQMVGLLLGAPLMTQISDLWGRKIALLATVAGETVFGIGTGFTHTWHAFAVCRFLVGFFGSGILPITGVYLIESVDKSNRMLFMSVGGVNFGFLLSAGIFFLFQHWRTLSIVANSAGIVALLIVGFACETPRWLLHHGKMEQARKSYRYILRLNRKLDKQLSDHEWEALLDKTKGQKCERRSFWHLFQNRRLSLNTVVLVFSMFTMNLICSMFLFSMNELAGSIYINSVIYGTVLSVGACFGSLIDRLFRSIGRKHMIGSLVSVFCVCLLGMSISKWIESSIHVVENILVFTGTAAAAPLWISMGLITMELYPTSMRSIAVGFTTAFANVGGVISPQLLIMAQKWKAIPWTRRKVTRCLKSSKVSATHVVLQRRSNSTEIYAHRDLFSFRSAQLFTVASCMF
uniref:Major facilitator superfamily (MFS) profile domain-containing protein n=1 Tax=Trichuris muris TaxID=70415 RepID=A0A5S6R1T0_TRIMR